MSLDKLQVAESKFCDKENYARVPFRTYSGDVKTVNALLRYGSLRSHRPTSPSPNFGQC